MSFIACVEQQALEGKVTKETMAEVKEQYDGLMAIYSSKVTKEQADARAAKEIVEARRELHTRRKQGMMEQVLRTQAVMDEVDTQHALDMSAYNALSKTQQFFNVKPTRANAVMTTLEGANLRGETILRELFSGLHDMTDTFGNEWVQTVESVASFKKVYGQMIDGDYSNPVAGSMREAMDLAHKQFRQAGGEIGSIENYMPQVHEASRIKEAGYESWMSGIESKLDLEKSKVDFKTGLVMSDEKWAKVTKQVFDDITSDGRSAIQRSLDEGKVHLSKDGAQDVWSSRQQSRIFHFKDSENYFEYQKDFGVDDRVLFSQYVGYLRGMSRDIGMMQTMGRAPNSTMKHLSKYMELDEGAKSKAAWTEHAFEVLSGGTDGGETGGLYRTLMGAQHLARSSMLGSAPLSALSDAVFAKMTASNFGLSGGNAVANMLGGATNQNYRQLTSNNAYIVDNATGSGVSNFRMNEGNDFIDAGNALERGLQWTSKTLHRASGLKAITNVTGDSNSMELAGRLGVEVNNKTTWDALDVDFKKSLEDHGITDSDWNIIQKAEVLRPDKGVNFVTPESIVKAKGFRADDVLEVSRKISDIDIYLRHRATNSPTLKVRALSTWGAKHGTVSRGVASSLGMFKSFPLSVWFNHTLPAISKAAKGDTGDLSTMLIGGTMLGALSLQLKDASKGREPRDMDNPKFWFAAAMQGGGFGIMGDFLFTEQGRFGHSFATTLLGPIAGMGDDALGITLGVLQKSILDDSGDYSAMDDFREKASKALKRYTPFNTLWYTRAATERILFEGVDRMLLTDFDATVKAKNKKVEEMYGNEQWWEAGDVTPQF